MTQIKSISDDEAPLLRSIIKVIDTFFINNNDNLEELMTNTLLEGYEGLVLRDPLSKYTFSVNGKRSRDTIKYKIRNEMDVQIVDFTSGIGKDTNCLVLSCKANNCDTIFKVV